MSGRNHRDINQYTTMKLKVLICEDEEVMMTALDFRLKKQNFETIKAEDGQVAKEKILAEKPDMIIADIMMPHVNGLELISFVREELSSQIPMIMISSLEREDVVIEAMQLGANDFISKPFRPDELILRIKNILGVPAS